MKCILFLFTLFACSLTANAGTFTSTEERADAVNAQLKGNNSYHAHLARELANIAVEEKGQHDTRVAKAFIQRAEEEAAQAGGAK